MSRVHFTRDYRKRQAEIAVQESGAVERAELARKLRVAAAFIERETEHRPLVAVGWADLMRRAADELERRR